MLCPNCGSKTGRLIIKASGTRCHACGGVNETGGARVSGILTRNSERLRHDGEHHKADVVIPHILDKASGKVVPNPEFVKLYPEKTSTFYSEEDVKASGDKRLSDLWKKQEADRAEHQADLDGMASGKDSKATKAAKTKLIKGL